MNNIHVYSIQTYEKQISHVYYYQIMTHEVCDVKCKGTIDVISTREIAEGTKAKDQERT
jgi:hypothetical protein